jgi:hypothetical protein
MALGPHRTAFVARELAPAGLRSSPKPSTAQRQAGCMQLIGAASRPSGSKLPRHGVKWQGIRSANSREPLWEPSLLAMAAAHPTSMQADPPLSRASPLPQGIGGEHGVGEHPRTLWEQGLPAMAAAHPTSMQTDPPLSRAGSLPHGMGGGYKPCLHPRTPVGASLLARVAAHPTSMQTDPSSSRARSLPHEIWWRTQTLYPPENTCGSELAREDGSTFNITAS